MEDESGKKPRAHTTTVGIAVAAAVIVLALVVTLVVVLVQRNESVTANRAGTESVPAGLEEFYQQDVDWQSCDGAECADVTVPVDYEKPEGKTLTLAVKRVPAKSDDARGPLLINPGGPGAPGISFLSVFESQASDTVRQHFDLIGFDPRGTGDSTPLKCFDDETLDKFNASDPTPDNPGEIKKAREWMTRLGEACQENSGELAAHVSTEETARDMDVLRSVLDARKMDYYGASYGTQLGATYATLFPENAGRMVLDGAVDPSLDAIDFAKGQNEGFQRALNAYMKSCASDDSCPLGTDTDAMETKLRKFLDGLDEEPLTVDNRKLTEGLAMYGIAVTLYNKQSWESLTLELAAALEGNGAMMLRLSDAYFDRDADGTYKNNSTEANIAISCMDEQEDVSASEVKSAIPEFEKTSPVFGSFMAWGTMACSQWPIEAKHPQPEIDAADADPILVVGTTRDPATPYEWSKALRDQLGSGVLLTREGDGHTGYHQGSQCTDDAIDDYLVEGEVPDDGTTCEE